MSDLSLDWETRSEIDLTKRGPYIYAYHPSTDALLASYSIGHGPIRRWKRGDPCPDDIAAHVAAGGVISAHNAAFERLIWWLVMTRKHGWPKPRIEQFRCTATTAAAMSLPRSLERLGDALDLTNKKDKRGKDLMKIHSIPTGFDAAGNAIWHTLADDPASLEEYHQYCDSDVIAEMEADRRLVPLSDHEQAVFVLSEKINDRGIRIDVRSARAALEIIAKAKLRINRELTSLTGGYVTAVTQTAKLKAWIENQGVVMPSMDKDDVEEFLHEVDDLPDRVRQALELRQEGAKPSVEKIGAMLDRVCSDGRARGVYLHNGAGQTRRFSSRGLQAHNMPKYRKEFEALFEKGLLRLDTLFENIRYAEPALLELQYGPKIGRPLHLLSDAVRSFIWAAPGYELIDADYSSIEGRMAAWFAGEEWKLDAFRALDAGTGPGMYELTAAGIYNVPVAEVTKPQRGVGKVGELSMGYQGGIGALAKMARQNKLKLHTVYGSVWESADSGRRDAAEARFEECTKKGDPAVKRLGREGWLAAELIKVGWRAKHLATCQSWQDLNDAGMAAVQNPGTVVSALRGRVRYIVRHGFMWCLLPSNGVLAYGRPRIGDVEAPWADKTVEPAKREKIKSVTALGVDPQTEKWVRSPLYGGKYFNNVVQGSARDILVHGMFTVERHGLPVVLHTHDEMAIEVPVGSVDVKWFEQLLCQLPDWAAGLPLTADGWASKRYHK
jgi:DNA polymerase